MSEEIRCQVCGQPFYGQELIARTAGGSPIHSGCETRATRTVHDPFLGKDVQISNRLVDRLRGKYASGPHLPNGNPEFGWKQFQAPPIQHEAAKRIDALEAALREVVATETDRYACASERNAVFERARKVLEGKND